MQANPVYSSVAEEVEKFLTSRVEACEKGGISRNRIVLDPGFGFGKTQTDNALLFQSIGHFVGLKLPVLVGISRKSMVKNIIVIKRQSERYMTCMRWRHWPRRMGPAFFEFMI